MILPLCPHHGPSGRCDYCRGTKPLARDAVGARRKKADGSQHEKALVEAVRAAGLKVYPSFNAWFAEWFDHDPRSFVPQFRWGLGLTPERRFRSDLAAPFSRLLVEVEGIAHKIGHQRESDVKRRQLAEGAGWRVLSLLPSQVHDGTAIELVKAALAAKDPR